MCIDSDNRVKEEKLQLKSTSQYQESVQVEDDKPVEGDYHPEYGQLPPAPSRVPAQPMVSYDHESITNDHPEYGKLPPTSSVLDSTSEYGLGSPAHWSSHSESTETEPGGQSVYNSMSSAQMSDVFHASVSTPTGSLSDCSFGSYGQDTMEVTKLKAMVQHLNDRLLEANAKLDEKEAKIQELEKRLEESQHKGTRDDRMMSKDCKKVDLAYAQPRRHSSSPYHVESSTVYGPCRYTTVPTIPGNHMDHFHHRAGDTVVYNLNYSRNTTNASVSTL